MRTPPRNTGFQHPYSSEITPKAVYEDRRQMLKRMAGGAAGVAIAAWAGRQAMAQQVTRPGKLAALASTKSAVAGAVTMEKLTDYKDASTYNNFYEFGTDKADPARNAHTLKTTPWTVEVEGLIKKPGKYGIEDLLKLSAQEERIYRLRCVEGWSMVIPWVGYSLAELIKRVEPMGSAKYVGWRLACMARCCPTRTARPCAWWCHGSTASRAPRASSRSASSRKSLALPGTRQRSRNTAFIPT